VQDPTSVLVEKVESLIDLVLGKLLLIDQHSSLPFLDVENAIFIKVSGIVDVIKLFFVDLN